MPVKLKDVQFAMTGEQPQEGYGNTTYSPQIPVTTNHDEFVVLRLVKEKKGRVHLDGKDSVVNPNTKKKTAISVLKGVDTIWYNEQKDIPESLKNVSGDSLLFENSFCLVNKKETQWMDFINVCSSNIDSPNFNKNSKYPFYVYDAAREAQAILDKELEEAGVIVTATNQKAEDMRKHAAFLGIQFHDRFGIPKNDNAIRAEYIVAAKRNPANFKKTLGSKEIQVFHLVQSAIVEAKIDIGGTDGNAYWANGGGMICKMPRNTNPLQYLVELAMTNSNEGKRFLDQLKQIG